MALQLMNLRRDDHDVICDARHVTAWQCGTDGERSLSEFLDEVFDGRAVVLHDRLVGGNSQRGNIDHLIIATSGVWVVDAKKRDGLAWRAAAVQCLLTAMGMGAVPVHPAVCFGASEWSRRPNATVIDDVLVVSPDKLHSVASQPGELQADAIDAIADQLSSGLPAVTPR